MYPDVSLFYPVSLYAPQSQGTEGPGGPGPGLRLGKAGGSGQAAGDPGAGPAAGGRLPAPYASSLPPSSLFCH